MAFDPLDAYAGGLMGCKPSPRSDEVFADYILRHGGQPDGATVAHEWEFADAGKGKLILLHPVVERVFGNVFPGPPQVTGDCVARAAAWGLLTSTAFEIDSGKPDEITGRVEEAPKVPEKGVKSGVISSISLWAWRGRDGDGWICSEAAKVASEQGFLLCKPYPELKIDLTEYGEHNIGLGGSRAPSKAWLDESKQHTARTATFLKGREQVRDMLHRGYGVFNCSSMAFERTRDDSGWAFSRQVGVWHHAQQYLGYDDRPETHKRWGQALVLWNNSHWGKWNSGPRKVYGTDIEIPHGTFWTLASTIDRATNIALSSVAGWPRRKHTTFGATGNV